MNARILFGCLTVALGLPSLVAGQAPQAGTDAWSVRLEQSELLATQGQIAEAEKAYRAALQQAADPQQKAESALGLAKLLAARGDASAAAELFILATREAQGKLRVEAHNSYGVFLLRQGDAEQAASVLGAVAASDEESSEDFDSAARSRLLYNYGNALERAGRGDEAAEAYQEAVDLDPGFAPACAAAFRLAAANPSWQAGIQRLATLVERLLAAGETETVARYLQGALKSGSSASYPEISVLVARYLTVAKIGPDPKGRPSGVAWLPSVPAERMDLVLRSYSGMSGELPLLLDPEEGRRFASAWQDSDRSAAAFSGLLQMLGDWYLRNGQPAQALPRYALAWSSSQNLAAAVQLASLLQSAPQKVDPDGQVLNRLIGVLFEGKGEAYLQADWPNILRFHTVLATIFERQGKWGSSEDPRSAIFQWEHALAAQQRLQQMSQVREQTLAPGLHARLAVAYKAVGREDEALSQLLLSGKQYLELGRPEAANDLVQQAVALAPKGEKDKKIEAMRREITLRLQGEDLVPEPAGPP